MQFPVVVTGSGLGGGPPAGRVPGQIGVARARITTSGRRQQASRGRPNGRDFAGHRHHSHVRQQLERRYRRCPVRGRGSRSHATVQRSAGHASRDDRTTDDTVWPPTTDRGLCGHHADAAPEACRPDRVQPEPTHGRPSQTHQAHFRPVVVVLPATRRCGRRCSRPTRSDVAAVVIAIVQYASINTYTYQKVLLDRSVRLAL